MHLAESRKKKEKREKEKRKRKKKGNDCVLYIIIYGYIYVCGV